MLDLERESCPEILRQAAVLLERENRRLIEKTLKLQQENEALKGASPEELALKLQILEEQLSAVRRRLFAASSEKLPQDFPQESAPPSNAAPRKGHGRAEQPRLLVFLDDPRVPLDNNQAERALRGVAVGRKNHYGSKSKRGAEVTAFFYSVIETCKLCRVEPKGYLQGATRAFLSGTADYPLPHELPANR